MLVNLSVQSSIFHLLRLLKWNPALDPHLKLGTLFLSLFLDHLTELQWRSYELLLFSSHEDVSRVLSTKKMTVLFLNDALWWKPFIPHCKIICTDGNYSMIFRLWLFNQKFKIIYSFWLIYNETTLKASVKTLMSDFLCNDVLFSHEDFNQAHSLQDIFSDDLVDNLSLEDRMTSYKTEESSTKTSLTRENIYIKPKTFVW